ncbi:hypothetical protein HMPREF1015_00118 [Bacillus smithii 7_3_47FAA]|uniref:Uncharacterized protein n=1 Tax=Bacillus smithii 7_3_47FAA TaxID=665952 RepID=G9QPA1_9BACI|nr:hypothetical protein HMPREF1015_00118 [Bacillus smithii 7_3_47FAA]
MRFIYRNSFYIMHISYKREGLKVFIKSANGGEYFTIFHSSIPFLIGKFIVIFSDIIFLESMIFFLLVVLGIELVKIDWLAAASILHFKHFLLLVIAKMSSCCSVYGLPIFVLKNVKNSSLIRGRAAINLFL